MKPKKWTDIYPHGTKEGDEELKFFIAIARNPKYQWRSTSAIAKEAGLDPKRVEEIINKYYKKGMVFQNPKNEDQWGYWERVPEMLPKMQKSISQKDQDDRVNKLNKCGDDCNCDFSLDPNDQNDSPSCDMTVSKDGHRLFYIDIKPSDRDKFVQKVKEQFQQKWVASRQLQLLDDALVVYNLTRESCNTDIPHGGWAPPAADLSVTITGLGDPGCTPVNSEVVERWHAPAMDEDIWIPIRPMASGSETPPTEPLQRRSRRLSAPTGIGQ